MIVERDSPSRVVFKYFNFIFLVSISMATLFPFVNVIASSFATSLELLQRPFMIFPRQPTLLSYRYIFSTQTYLRSMGISIYVTVVGTVLSLVLTFITAYPLSYKGLIGRGILMNLVVFTMLFSGGMVPSFLNIRSLGLINSLWSVILTGAISTYNLIIAKNFIQRIPDELKDAARIDGANEMYILVRIILPLSLPILATLGLFYAVGNWNIFLNFLLYINDSSKWNVQVLLRQIVTISSGIGDSELMRGEDAVVIPDMGVRSACILVSTLPILIVYPWLQKYFAKGALIGAIKG